MRALEHELVGHARRNPDNISGRKFLPGAALNGAVALLMGRNSFPVYQYTPHHQRRGAGLYEEYIHLRFVPLRLTVRFSVNQ